MGMETSARRGRPAAAEQAARREAILNAATAEFLANGFAGTTIEAVATRAQATKRTIYVHFTDKTGLFAAAIGRQHEYIRQYDGGGGLEDASLAIVAALHSDQAVALHRLVMAEALRFPELAAAFYENGPARSITFLADRLGPADAAAAKAQLLYTLLLGENHRQRLLGLADAPSPAQARAQAREALAALGLG